MTWQECPLCRAPFSPYGAGQGTIPLGRKGLPTQRRSYDLKLGKMWTDTWYELIEASVCLACTVDGSAQKYTDEWLATNPSPEPERNEFQLSDEEMERIRNPAPGLRMEDSVMQRRQELRDEAAPSNKGPFEAMFWWVLGLSAVLGAIGGIAVDLLWLN